MSRTGIAAEPAGRRRLAGLALLFLLTLPLVNPYLRGDGVGYYAYVRSVAIDGDLHFENEYRRAEPAFVRSAFDAEGRLTEQFRLPSGYVHNQWAVGPSLLWAPFFAVGHVAAVTLSALGADVEPDGLSAPYLWLCAVGTALYAFAALVLAWRLAARVASPWAALVATLGIWFASPLPAYMYFLPFQAHALAAFAVSLFLFYGYRTRPGEARSFAQWALWGALGGLMVEVYYVNAILLLFAVPDLRQALRRERAAEALRAAAAFGGAAAVVLLPHFATRWILYGSPLETGYVDDFAWNAPRLWQLAFGANHGLFSWHPVLLAAIAGLVLLLRRERWLAGGALASFAVFFFVIASHDDWHGLSSFGNRFFLSFTPLFVVGLAAAMERLVGDVAAAAAAASRHLRRAAVAGLLALLALWNFGFLFQWGTNIVPNRGPVDFREVARNQITVVPARALDVGLRYLTSRREVTEEIEAEDMQEVREWRKRR